MDIVCGGCAKEDFNTTKRNSYFINESDTSAPKSVINIKVNAKNFIIQRTKNIPRHMKNYNFWAKVLLARFIK